MSRSKSRTSMSEEESLEMPRKTYVNSNQRVVPYVNEGKPTMIVSIVGIGDDSNNQLLGADSGTTVDPHLENMTCLDIVCGPNFNMVNEANPNSKYRRVWTWGKSIERKCKYFDIDMLVNSEVRELTIPVGRESNCEDIHAIPELWRKDIVQVTAGVTHGAALTKEGDVYTWGIYRQNGMDIGMRPHDADLKDPVSVTEPELVEDVILDRRIVQIASAAHVTYALAENGDVFHWGGHRASNQFTSRTVEAALCPQTVRFPGSKVCAIFANSNSDNVFAVTRRGRVFGWGPNSSFQVGHEVEKPFTQAQRKKVAEANKKKKVGNKGHFGPRHSDYYYIPKECHAIHKVVNPVSVDEVDDIDDYTPYIGDICTISSGRNHGALCTTDGDVYCWGSNEFGQCSGDADDYVIPTKVKIPGEAADIACGANFTIVLTKDSKVYGFGVGEDGRLGPRGKKKTRKPVLVSEGLGDVEIIAAGKKHCLLAINAE